MAGIHEGRRPEGASNRRVVEDHIPCMASHSSVVPSVLPQGSSEEQP